GVVCGHIHAPNVREIDIGGRPISYVNSGDWVDSQSALEWHDGAWSVRRAGAALPAPSAITLPGFADSEPATQVSAS
nr:hypothetical protein [Planctomycetota bacterium]